MAKKSFLNELPSESYISDPYVLNYTVYVISKNGICIGIDEGESWIRKYDVATEIYSFSKDNSNIVIRYLNTLYI